MRIRLPFAGTFFALLLAAAYIGLTPLHLETYINDKALHLVTFFLLTTVFYWILDTTRRRTLHLTLLVCTAVLAVGSELLQALLPNGRVFDMLDIAANVAGSLAGLGLCTWYHKRMIERRRAQRGYGAVAGEDDGEDLEMGVGGLQEDGVVDAAGARSLEDEVDNWDENAVDEWDEDLGGEDVAVGRGKEAAAAGDLGDIGDSKKRSD
ncbi:hypothetical protein BN1723_010864 [Verticillium longisporum]|uniref:VanZ-like domain-containing protein n=1 Tax=Verticillium longisporum TaxID=100787 RepID=A0A0G4N4J0_VERLO|nr:hypothetical protein HYQ44_005018 [Verticillium longisporum]CRK15955.1 hypothetical protein BN1723_010864 [Verticillium longisporum]CRK41521.1 hypothetical protein BN1708_001845 [Verticillium longisporum]